MVNIPKRVERNRRRADGRVSSGYVMLKCWGNELEDGVVGWGVLFFGLG